MKDVLIQYQWLIGLIIGFLLNQVAVSIERMRRKKESENIFKKDFIFMKTQLDYFSVDLEKVPYTTFIKEDYKEKFVKEIENLRENLLQLNKSNIPNKLINDMAELTGDLRFLNNIVKLCKIGKSIQSEHDQDKFEFIESVAKRQRQTVLKIFRYLKI